MFLGGRAFQSGARVRIGRILSPELGVSPGICAFSSPGLDPVVMVVRVFYEWNLLVEGPQRRGLATPVPQGLRK